MGVSNLVPILDPNPLPAPYWVFKVLLVVTFFLHILAMNFMLGGALLALVAKWRARSPELGKRVFFDLAHKLPALLPATITLGIAPLLFVQVLYGQFFYTSSIILAWPWFCVLVLLTTAYYGFYYVSLRGEKRPRRAAGVLSFSVVLILIVGFIYTNNITLSQTPARWGAKYFANPGGWNLNLSESTLIPRVLHFFTAAVAVGGILLVLIACTKWQRDREYAHYIFQFGGKAFMYATMAQFLVGIWFVVTLPPDIRLLFVGYNAFATMLLLLAIAGAMAAIYVMVEALRTENIRLAARYVTGLTAAVILSMSVLRAFLRDAYLKPYYHPQQFLVKTQWSVLPIFLVLFVGGVILWFVMLKRYGFFRSKGAVEQERLTSIR